LSASAITGLLWAVFCGQHLFTRQERAVLIFSNTTNDWTFVGGKGADAGFVNDNDNLRIAATSTPPPFRPSRPRVTGLRRSAAGHELGGLRHRHARTARHETCPFSLLTQQTVALENI
jgi:hypothetical protein